jgi:DNA-binding NtrC family response regulator
MEALQRYPWPGNIRELRNHVERAMILATGPRLTIALPAAFAAASKRSLKLVDVEKDHIRSILDGTGWRIRGAGGAADRLGLRPTTLETRMAKLGLKRPRAHQGNFPG